MPLVVYTAGTDDAAMPYPRAPPPVGGLPTTPFWTTAPKYWLPSTLSENGSEKAESEDAVDALALRSQDPPETVWWGRPRGGAFVFVTGGFA